MKKIIILLATVLISLSCNNNEKKVEVINLDFSNYYSFKDINEKEGNDNKTAIPLSNSKDEKSVKSVLLDKLKRNEAYQNLSAETQSENYRYQLLVNEKGNVDKVLIERSMGKELDNLVVNEVVDWKFEPAMINGEYVKYNYDLEFDGTEYFPSVERMPEPIGGLAAIAKLVKYPEAAKKAGIQGKVFAKAFINESGTVDSVSLIKGIGYGCDESAVEALKQVKFKPAVDNGVNVKSQVVVPIFFKLQ